MYMTIELNKLLGALLLLLAVTAATVAALSCGSTII